MQKIDANKIKNPKVLIPILAVVLIISGTVGYALTTLWSGQAVKVSGVAKPNPTAAVSTLSIDLGNVTAGEEVSRNGTLTISVSPSNKEVNVRLQLAKVEGIEDYEIRFYRGNTLVGIIDPIAYQIQVSQTGTVSYTVVMNLKIANVTQETPVNLTITGVVEG